VREPGGGEVELVFCADIAANVAAIAAEIAPVAMDVAPVRVPVPGVAADVMP
jgi:hypothetical protein